MSVFKKLKGTFQNAQQDIVDGLRALTSLDTQSRHEQLRSIKTRDISLDAGADLLYSYQKCWSSIQLDTKESAKKAEEIDSLLTPLFKVWDRHTESAARLEEEVKAIPSILTTLEQLHTLLDGLRQDFNIVEKELDVLENLCEEQDLKKRCLEEQRKLEAYKVQKAAEAERAKVDLAQHHARKISQLETAKRMKLQERKEAFTDAFQDDLNYYRAHGHSSRLPTEFPKVSSLSEIEIDADKQALDSFLGPDGEAENSQGSLELSGEGAYIEDDYLPEYAIKEDEEFVEDPAYLSENVISKLTVVDDEDDDDYQDAAHEEAHSKDKEDSETKDKTETIQNSSEAADVAEPNKDNVNDSSNNQSEIKQDEKKENEKGEDDNEKPAENADSSVSADSKS